MRFKIIFTTLFLIAFTTFSPAKPRPKAKRNLVIPTAQESLKTLIFNGKIRLDSIASCKALVKDSDNRTILDYFTDIIGTQAGSAKQNSFDYGISLITGKNNSRFWKVEMLFYSKIIVEEKEKEMLRGFKFVMRTQDKSLLPGTLNCIK